MGRILAVGEYLDRFAELEDDFDEEKETGDSNSLFFWAPIFNF